jgi:transposase
MRRIWVQQFYISEGRVCWRTEEEGLPPGSLWINTPHDPEARLSCKRTTSWVGYKVHLTESCDDDQPHLITHVETDNATAAENDAIEKVHQALEERELLPATHLVDSGYVDAKQLIRSKGDFGVDLLGPPKADPSWQAKAGEGFAASDFKIDWQRQQATCPAGHVSQRWNPVRGRYKEPVISVAFSARDCASCAHRQKCTRARVRNLTLRPKEQYMALLEARQRESEKDFQTTYSRRAGIEGTISQSVRRMHLRRSRYIGLAKTHLQHVLTALALNLVRLGAWFHGNTPEATRKTAFKRLMSEPAYA